MVTVGSASSLLKATNEKTWAVAIGLSYPGYVKDAKFRRDDQSSHVVDAYLRIPH